MNTCLKIDLPDGWEHLSGSGPVLEEEVPLPDHHLLVKSPADLYVDISWIPENHPQGQWVCRALTPGSFPVKYLETSLVQEVVDWFKATIG